MSLGQVSYAKMLEMMSKSFCPCNFGCLVMRGFVVTQREGFGFRGSTTGHRKQEKPGMPHTFFLFQSSPNTLFL